MHKIKKIFLEKFYLEFIKWKNKYYIHGSQKSEGLFFDNKKNIVFSTEHGPAGGDEININFSPGKKIENFGWPKSSYGEHYKEGGIAYHTGYESNERGK